MFLPQGDKMRIPSTMVEGFSELIRQTFVPDSLLAKMVTGCQDGCVTEAELAEELACHPEVIRINTLLLAQVANKLTKGQRLVH